MMIETFLFSTFQLTSDSNFLGGLIEFGSGIFSLVLFGISLYSWSRNRQSSVLLVSIAFLLFFFKQILDIVSFLNDFQSEWIENAADFAILILFFLALVVRPRRRLRKV